MVIELVHIGFGNILAMNRVIAIASPNSAPTKRTIQESRSKGLLIDMTNGRRTKAVIFTDSAHIILAALAPETITGRSRLSRTEVTAIRPPTNRPFGAIGCRQRCRVKQNEETRLSIKICYRYHGDYSPQARQRERRRRLLFCLSGEIPGDDFR